MRKRLMFAVVVCLAALGIHRATAADGLEQIRAQLAEGKQPKRPNSIAWEGLYDHDLAILAEAKELEHVSFYERVGSLDDIPECGLTDAWIDYLEGLNHLEYLNCAFLPFTDHGLQKLQFRKDSLRHLGLYHTQVTDAGLAHLPEFERLESVTLTHTVVTDAGMVQLTRLPRLKRVSLQHTKVTDQGIATLRGCKQLEWLDLGGPQITDASLKLISQMPRMRRIYLYSTAVTDAGIAALAGTRITHLSLIDSQITDRGMAKLKRLPNLKHISVNSNSLTDTGVAQLQPLKQLHGVSVGPYVSERAVKDLRQALPSPTPVHRIRRP